MKAGELSAGERVATETGFATVESVTERPGEWRTYNLNVEGEHRYLVGELGVVVHNANEDCSKINPQIPGSNPYRKAGLPTRRGKVRFIPRSGKDFKNPLKGPNGGWVDREGREWVKGPPHHFPGDPWEWDVQMPDGSHINVSIHGESPDLMQ